jgi:predicted PurR-regulated permease PerM
MPSSDPNDICEPPSLKDTSDSVPSRRARVLLGLVLLASAALGWILLPFYGTLMWSIIIAVLFMSTNRWILGKMHGRRNLAAMATMLLVLLIVVLPLAIVSGMLSHELALLYQQVQAGETKPAVFFQRAFGMLPPSAVKVLHALGLGDFVTAQRKLSLGLAQASQWVAGQVFSFGQDTFNFVVSTFVTLYISFFMIRDGHDIAHLLRRGVPLARQHKQELQTKFVTVIRATVKGNLLVACIQGMLGGLAFWFLDVGGALLWAVLMAILSLLPAVGAALVWLPVAIYFFVTGSIWQGVALCAWGVIVIGLIDNLLRPVLVGRDTGLPDYLVLITTIGGIAVFGINGFVLGPVIAAMFIATWHIYFNANAL